MTNFQQNLQNSLRRLTLLFVVVGLAILTELFGKGKVKYFFLHVFQEIFPC